MRKLIVLTSWLMIAFSGLLFMIIAPQSWSCSINPVSWVGYTPDMSGLMIIRGEGDAAELWAFDGDAPVRRYRFSYQVNLHSDPAYAPDGRSYATVSP